MAIIVETGSGSPNSESYCSVVYADIYHAGRGYVAWDNADDKEAALRKATDYMGQRFRGMWRGYRHFKIQALDWPRVGVVVDRFVVVDSDIVPDGIIRACAEYALRAATGDLQPDRTQTVVRKKIGEIEVEYDKSSPQTTRYDAVSNLLSPYLSAGGGATSRLVRS